MKAQQSVSERAVFSSSSSMSCISSSAPSEQTSQEVQNRVFMEIDPEPVDEILLNFFPEPNEISMDVLLGWIDEIPVSDSVAPAEELTDFTRLEDAFPISDFIGVMHEPLVDDYIGLADIGHLPLPMKDPEFNLDAELDWSGFDFTAIEHEFRFQSIRGWLAV